MKYREIESNEELSTGEELGKESRGREKRKGITTIW